MGRALVSTAQEGFRLTVMPEADNDVECGCTCTCREQEGCRSLRESPLWCRQWAHLTWVVKEELSPEALDSALEHCLHGCGQKWYWAVPRREESGCWSYRILLFVESAESMDKVPSLSAFSPRVTEVDGLSFDRDKCVVQPLECCVRYLRRQKRRLLGGGVPLVGAGAAAGFGSQGLFALLDGFMDIQEVSPSVVKRLVVNG